jgi:hypothetical protein
MMNMKAFVEKLRAVSDGKVQLDEESALDASSYQVSRTIADGLEHLLPPTMVIHDSVQVSAFKPEPEWSGQLGWLLLTDVDVVQLQGRVGETAERSTLRLEYQFHRVADLRRVVATLEHQEQDGSTHLRAVYFELVFSSTTLTAVGHYLMATQDHSVPRSSSGCCLNAERPSSEVPPSRRATTSGRGSGAASSRTPLR